MRKDHILPKVSSRGRPLVHKKLSELTQREVQENGHRAYFNKRGIIVLEDSFYVNREEVVSDSFSKRYGFIIPITFKKGKIIFLWNECESILFRKNIPTTTIKEMGFEGPYTLENPIRIFSDQPYSKERLIAKSYGTLRYDLTEIVKYMEQNKFFWRDIYSEVSKEIIKRLQTFDLKKLYLERSYFETNNISNAIIKEIDHMIEKKENPLRKKRPRIISRRPSPSPEEQLNKMTAGKSGDELNTIIDSEKYRALMSQCSNTNQKK